MSGRGALRRLPHLAGFLFLLVTAAVIFVGPASAQKRPPGTHAVRFVATDPTSAGILEPVNLIDPAGNVLPTATCGLSLQQAGTNLSATVQGWETDPDPNDPRGLRVVWLQARVSGTLADTAGHFYRVDGRFVQSGLQTFPSSEVPFDGTGQVTVVGPAGLVRGTAEFRQVSAPPAEWDFLFSSIQTCRPT